MSNVIDLRQFPPHKLEEIEKNLAFELFWGERPISVIGGYAVRPKKIAELRPYEIAGIRANLSSLQLIHLPVEVTYYCPVCSAVMGKIYLYKKRFTLTSTIGASLSKKFALYTDKCPMCGSETYLFPKESKFVPQIIATASDDSGRIATIINTTDIHAVKADLTGVLIPLGMHRMFYAFGIEPIEESLDYIKVFQMTGTDPSIISHILATFVKPDQSHHLTSVIVANNLASVDDYINIARIIGAKIVRGYGSLLTGHHNRPVVLIVTKYQHLFKAIGFNGPHNLIIIVPGYLYNRVSLRRDITIVFNNYIQLPSQLAQLVIRAMFMNPPDVHGTLCRSVMRFVQVQKCHHYLEI